MDCPNIRGANIVNDELNEMTSALLSDQELDALIQTRRLLHQKPEVSGQEEDTAGFIVQRLHDYGPDQIVEGLGGHGVAAVFEGAEPGATLMFRCELDGLPILEVSDLAHRSLYEGKGHLCGHDGHMSILLGLGQVIARDRPVRGRVVLLFQPAEEDGSGAKAVLEDPAFAALRPDMSFSLHNYPGVELNHVLLRAGPVNCASRGLRLCFDGKTAHAAQPEHGVAPTPAIAACLAQFSQLADEVAESTGNLAMATITHCQIGEAAFGIAPGQGEIWVTLRTLLDNQMAQLSERIETFATDVARQHGLRLSMEVSDDFSHCENSPEAVKIFAKALDTLGVPYCEDGLPIRASEDFGRFRACGDSAMIFLGAGLDHPKLHNPDYDFPDDLIRCGVEIFDAVRKLCY